MQKLLINEIFPSIQGEGKSIGKPVLFIRSYGCNSHCNFCDSKYSWEKSKEKFEVTIPEVVAEVLARAYSQMTSLASEIAKINKNAAPKGLQG